jgi:hypothetical protein
MKSLVPILGGSLCLAGCERGPAEPRVAVENAVVTVPAVPGGAGAAYFTITTNNDPSRLVSITSPSIGSIELHHSRQAAGVSSMAPLQPGDASFDPEIPLSFAPGGKHAMLIGMDPALRPGSRVTLTFHVEPAAPVTVEAEVRGPGQVHAGH